MTRRIAPLLLYLASVAAPAPADEPVPAAGTGLFRELFALEGFRPLRDPRQVDDDPTRTVVVFQGFPHGLPGAEALATSVLDAGGAVLVATDEPANLGAFFGDRRNGPVVMGAWAAARNPDRAADGDPRHPFPDPFPLGPGDPGHELFAGLTQVGTNLPSFLRTGLAADRLTVLARFPADVRVGSPNGPLLPDDQAFAVLAHGSFLAVADPGVFINQSLARRDWQNLALAVRVVRFLRGNDGPRRNRCLFVENGTVRDNFQEHGLGSLIEPGTPAPPVPDPLDPRLQALLTEAGNKGLQALEDNDILNRAMVGTDDDRRYARTLRVIAALMTAAAAVWLVTMLRKTRHAADVPPPPRELGAGIDAPPAGTLALRRLELMRGGNLTEPVRDYLRGLFAPLGLEVIPPGAKLPPIQATGPGGRQLRDDLRAVWDAVFGPDATPVTAERWKELEPMIDDIRRAAEAGRFRFAPKETA